MATIAELLAQKKAAIPSTPSIPSTVPTVPTVPNILDNLSSLDLPAKNTSILQSKNTNSGQKPAWLIESERLKAEHANRLENAIASLTPIHQEKSAQDNVSINTTLKSSIQDQKKKLSFKELLELKQKDQAQALENHLAEQRLASSSIAMDKPIPVPASSPVPDNGTFSLNIVLNEKQEMAKDLALAGKSFVLTGAAGTGKTATQRSIAEILLKSGALKETTYKPQGGGGERVTAPSIAFVAYTRRASANLERAIHKDPVLKEAFAYNIMTVHALLEYEPEYFEDPEDSTKTTMRFVPRKTGANPLNITHLVIEESSMLGLDLWENLYDALPLGVQIIFIGDINQLTPVFGPSILNYALVQLPVVNLEHVYRQAGDSYVLKNAHNILAGKEIEEGPGFTVIRGKQSSQVTPERMTKVISKMLETFYSSPESDPSPINPDPSNLKMYDPNDCIVLCPFNKGPIGTTVLNNRIAQFLGQERGAVVFEVIAGFAKHYLAVGDRVMVNKQDSIITNIKPNYRYMGKEPLSPSPNLTRFGTYILDPNNKEHFDDSILDEPVLNYSNFSVESIEEEMTMRKQQASHVVEVLTENGLKLVLSNAGEFGEQVFSLGYALTVHKAQGCEWRKVFVVLHSEHATLLNRELLYTAVTRARENLVLIAKDFIIAKAIKNQRIKGNTVEDKIEYFNAKIDFQQPASCTK